MKVEHIYREDASILAVRGLKVELVREALQSIQPVANMIFDAFNTSESFRQLFESKKGLRNLLSTVTAGKDWYGMLVKDEPSHFADFTAFMHQFPDYVELYHLPHPFEAPDDFEKYDEYLSQIRAWNDKILDEFLERVAFSRTQSEKQVGDSSRFVEAAMNACTGRRLFFTQEGVLGLGPMEMETGDILCVLFGGNVPFILRPEGGHYSFVGECYIEGLMKGQAIERFQRGELIMEEFDIR